VRVTRIREDGGRRDLELHPRLTVIVGLGPDAHRGLADALVAGADGCARVVDLDAVRAELDPLELARRLRLDAVEAATTVIVRSVERALGLLDQELEEVAVRRARLGAELADARRALDPLAPDAAAEAQELVDRLSEELGAIPGTGYVVPRAALASRVVHLEEELRTTEGEDAELEAALEEAVAALAAVEVHPTPTMIELDDPRLAAAIEQLDVARARWNRHEDALAAVTELLRSLDELEEDEELAATQRDELAELLATARRSEELARVHAGLDRTAAATSVVEPAVVRSVVLRCAEEICHQPSAAGGLLVVAGVLDVLPFSAVVELLDVLAGIGAHVQVVVLTEHSAAGPWAEASDPQSVALRRS
jgi:hypothetical protein